MLKVCERCGAEFETMGGAKYCVDCRSFVYADNSRRYYATHREEIKARRRKKRRQMT